MKEANTYKHLKQDSMLASCFMEIVENMSAVYIDGIHPSTVLKYGTKGARTIEREKEIRLIKRRIRKLKEKNLIKINKIGKDYSVSLTDKGKMESLRLKIIQAPMLKDDRVCMVIFDIPEQEERSRQTTRRLLKNSGFIPIQKSVWISPFDAGEALVNFFKTKNTKNWIRIYNAQEY